MLTQVWSNVKVGIFSIVRVGMAHDTLKLPDRNYKYRSIDNV